MIAFLLGKNPEIAKLEIFSFLQKFQLDFNLLESANEYLILNIAGIEKLDFQTLINSLGGSLRIVEIIQVLDDAVDFEPDELELFLNDSENFGQSDIKLNKSESSAIQNKFKNYFKKQKIKVAIKHEDGGLILPSNFFKWNLNETGEAFFIKNRQGKVYFGKTLACTNPKVYLNFDELRPARLFTHGTSFRLAQIMVNIFPTKPGKTIVDPFCGTGTFMIQGMINGLDVIGIDNDQELITAAAANINWAKTYYGVEQKSELIYGDAQDQEFKADGCVFEPYMGPFLKTLPRETEAKAIIEELNELYFQIFEMLSRNLSKKSHVVCILPSIRTKKNEIFELDKKIYQDNGFTLSNLVFDDYHIKNPLEYKTPSGSKIVRHLHVLELN
jgi:tRNA G10  N-methylase Trm11